MFKALNALGFLRFFDVGREEISLHLSWPLLLSVWRITWLKPFALFTSISIAFASRPSLYALCSLPSALCPLSLRCLHIFIDLVLHILFRGIFGFEHTGLAGRN